MGLRDQREAPAGHGLHQPYLPQRLGAIEPLREKAPGEPLQRDLIGRLRQGGVADVVVGVEVGVIGPHRPPLAVGDVGQTLAVARDEVQAVVDVVDEFPQRWSLAFEDHHRRDMHVRRRVVLEVQERRVQGGQPVGIGHAHRLSLLRRLASTIGAEIGANWA